MLEERSQLCILTPINVTFKNQLHTLQKRTAPPLQRPGG
jgi:hypothetical protein